MGVAAQLSGRRVTRARVDLPESGLWFAEVEIDTEEALTGKVVLTIADLQLRGTILSGGKNHGRSQFRIVAGAGAWGNALPEKSYQNDGGVKLATIIADAAREAGNENVGTIDPKLTVGPGWQRADGEPASRVLDRAIALATVASPQGWYVDEAGTLQIGKRAASKLPANVTRTQPIDPARRTVELASDSIATILPGVTVDDLIAVDVRHELSADSGLRSKIWGSLAGGGSRELDALRRLLEQLDPDRDFRGVTEFRVVSQNGNRLNLQPVRVSTGMPQIRNVHVRPGIAGGKSDVASGERVLVTFIEGDRSRPVVIGHEEADGAGFTPSNTTVKVSSKLDLGDSDGPPVARRGDTVDCGTIVLSSLGVPSFYYGGDVPPSTVNADAAQQKATDISGTVFPMPGGVIVEGADKVNAT